MMHELQEEVCMDWRRHYISSLIWRQPLSTQLHRQYYSPVNENTVTKHWTTLSLHISKHGSLLCHSLQLNSVAKNTDYPLLVAFARRKWNSSTFELRTAAIFTWISPALFFFFSLRRLFNSKHEFFFCSSPPPFTHLLVSSPPPPVVWGGSEKPQVFSYDCCQLLCHMLEMMCFLLCHTESSLPLKRLLFLPPSSSTVF